MPETETSFWKDVDSESVASPPPESAADHASADAAPQLAQASQSGPPAAKEAAPAPPAPPRGGGQQGRPKTSKSQRIRDFLAQNPDARNREVVEALQTFGVSPADVANVKTLLKRKAEPQPVAAEAPKPRRRSAARQTRTPAAAPAPSAARSSTPSGEIAIAELEAGLTFIEQAGGLDRARQIIDLVERIRGIQMD